MRHAPRPRSRLRAVALLCFLLALAARPALAQRSLADALGALDPVAAAQAARCAEAASGDALSATCSATLADISAAAAALDDAASAVSSDYDVAGAAAAFMTGALARAASSLPDFCAVPPGGRLSCAQELDVTVGSYLTRLAGGRGTRPGCSAEAGAAAAGGAGAAVSLLTRAACLRAEPSRGGGFCLATFPAALEASGLAAALAGAARGGVPGAAAAGLDPAVVCPALSAAGCCATSLLSAAQAALTLTCSPQRDAMSLALAVLPVLCSMSASPLPPACPGFVPPSHAPPSAADCAALGALMSGIDDGVGCALPPGACPASACDLYCAFDDVTAPAYTTDANAAPSPAGTTPSPPPRGTRPEDRGGGGATPAVPPGVAGGPPATKSSNSGASSGYGGIIAGAIFAVAALAGGTAWLYRTGQLGACWAQVHALIMAWQGQAAVDQGFELLGAGAGAAAGTVTQW